MLARYKIGTTILAIGFALLVPFTTAFAQQSRLESLPSGWHVYATGRVNPVAGQCANLSKTIWLVSTDGDHIQITESKPHRTEEPALPAKFKLEPRLQLGHRLVLGFDDGWLIGINAGEWGGGLWLTNKDGSLSKKVVMDNVGGLVPMGQSVLVLSGLAHMTFNFGTALMLSNPHHMNVALEWAVHLDAAPQSFTNRKDGSILVVTNYGIDQISRSGDLKRLLWLPQFRGYRLWSSSIAETNAGAIYMGSQMFVLRFSQSTRQDASTFSFYKIDWLLPDSCEDPCACKS